MAFYRNGRSRNGLSLEKPEDMPQQANFIHLLIHCVPYSAKIKADRAFRTYSLFFAIVKPPKTKIHRGNTMESQVVKGLIAVLAVMVVGFVIIGTTKETEQEKRSGAFLATSSLLSSLALDKCTAAVKQEVGINPYSPAESDTDRAAFVKLVWNNVGTAKRAECRYVMDQGITLLQIDDRTVIKKEASQTSGGAAPAGVHHQ